ncbi:unnamed protein product [Lota lota]
MLVCSCEIEGRGAPTIGPGGHQSPRGAIQAGKTNKDTLPLPCATPRATSSLSLAACSKGPHWGVPARFHICSSAQILLGRPVKVAIQPLTNVD